MLRFTHTNDINLAYDEQGTGDKTLILLHGLTANLRSFDGLLKAGLADKYRLIRVDLRGRGYSDKPETGYHMSEHAKDVLGLMNALDIDKATLVGHSFGGLLATYMAGPYARRIEKIVLMDAGLEATLESVVDKLRPSLERLKLRIADVEAAIDVMRKAPYFTNGRWLPEIEDWYRSEIVEDGKGGYRRLVYADGITEAIDNILADDWAEYFRAVQVPALLIHAPAPFGAEDATPILSLEGAQETVDLIPNCQYQQVSGHHITMIFGEHAKEVVAAISRFVD